MKTQDCLIVRGAREHNLKNVTIKIPKNQLVVFTGLSGSGKSSLAFDTIYAEGQRRYVESLSAYARQFLGGLNKPDVDAIEGLSPAISIDQKATSHNPRSTVGTITEIYDYLRLLFARIGHPHCPTCGREIAKQSTEQIVNQTLNLIQSAASQTAQARFLILAPVVKDRKGEFSGLLDNLKKKGYQRVRIDRQMFDLDEDILLLKTNKHTLEVVIERLSVTKKLLKNSPELHQLKSRVNQAIETALALSAGTVVVSQVNDKGLVFPEKPVEFIDHLFSEHLACPHCNISLPELEPRSFSFNSPHGACPTCHGLGSLLKIDPDTIINPKLTISEGAILPFASLFMNDTWFSRLITTVVTTHGGSVKLPYAQLPSQVKDIILTGSSELYQVEGTNRYGRITSFTSSFEGIIKYLERRHQETQSDMIRLELEKYMRKIVCPDCQGARLKPEILAVTIDNQHIAQVTDQSTLTCLSWARSITPHLSSKESTIAQPIIKELIVRLSFLVSVGLDYLTLSREATTLSGGEAQRIRLASQVGTGLTGVLYVLDEPTIGLHQRDNQQLIRTLKNLRDLGNSVIVVEHDRETIESADYIIDFGPAAGKWGGEVMATGTPSQIKHDSRSLTGQYLAGKKQIKITNQLTTAPTNYLTISGCRQFNLKNITAEFPLNRLIVVTGVSGSGKSTLIHTTLYRALLQHFGRSHQESPGQFTDLQGVSHIHRVSLIDQSPIGRTPRSNPVTYTKAFDHIRSLFALTKDALIRGYKPGRFSFNVKGGRCEACQGEGQVKIEMQFLPDVYVTCEVCHGQRYNSETLDVTYKGKNIDDILHFTVDEALEFFKVIPNLSHKLRTLQQVGLGYIELGQPAPTLSGGEAQRIKLAKELSIKSAGHTLYLLDEPTTGLHFEDLKKLLYVLRALVDQNNTVILIEHNLDVIKNADWVIDLGPEGGDRGGEIVAQGTPREVAQVSASYTGQFLKKLLH